MTGSGQGQTQQVLLPAGLTLNLGAKISSGQPLVFTQNQAGKIEVKVGPLVYVYRLFNDYSTFFMITFFLLKVMSTHKCLRTWKYVNHLDCPETLPLPI